MSNPKFKRYGRTKINKLDWLLAVSFCLFAIGALWISLGISIANKGPAAIEAFLTFVRGLAFDFNIANGQSAVVSMFVCIIFYGGVLLLCLGTLFLRKVGAKDRIPGVVAAFVTILGITLYVAFAYEFLAGKSSGQIKNFWPASLACLVCLFVCFLVCTLYVTFNRNYIIGLEEENEETPEEEVEAQPVYEEVVEEQPAEEEKVEEAPEEQPAEEEPVVEEEVEEVKEETEEAPEEENEEPEELDDEEAPFEGGEVDKFGALGPRRKRIPFENKVKRAKPEVRARYKLIVTALREYAFNDRKSIPCETFSYKKEKLIILAFSGQTLKAYFRLNPNDFADSPIPVKDASDVKKYEETPSCLIIKSDLAARRVVLLAEKIINERNIPAK